MLMWKEMEVGGGGGGLQIISESQRISSSTTITISELSEIASVYFELSNSPSYKGCGFLLEGGTLKIANSGNVPNGYGITAISGNTFTINWNGDSIDMYVVGV